MNPSRHLRGAPLHMSGAPVFAAATQGMPLNHLTLEVGSWCACLGLLERTPKRQVSASCPHQGTAQTGDCSTPPGFLWKTPTCLSWSFRLRCHFQVWHTSEGLRGDAQGTEARGDVITTLPQHSSSVVSQKPQFLWLSPRGHLQILWWPSGPTLAAHCVYVL